MNMVELEQRVQMLQVESQKAAGQVASFSENLEKSKINLHTINGHLNEATFQLNMLKNPVPQVPDAMEPVKECEAE